MPWSCFLKAGMCAEVLSFEFKSPLLSPRTSIEPPTDRVNRATCSFARGSNMGWILALFECAFGGYFHGVFGCFGLRSCHPQRAPAFHF